MKEIQIKVPRDALRALLEGKQANVPITIQGGEEPLVIRIFAGEPTAPQGFVQRRPQ